MSSTIQVEAARIPDRDRLLELLLGHGLDARPHDEVGLEVRYADGDSHADEVFEHVEQVVFDLGAPFVPLKHDGVIYIRPPLS